MGRFNKASVAADIRARAAAHQAKQKFNLSHGTAQLYSASASDREKLLIERAIDYGAMRALEGVAEDIEGGYLGVTNLSSR